MSDTRREIAERIVKEATPYAHLGNAQYVNAQALCEKCMSEYAATLLEREAERLDKSNNEAVFESDSGNFFSAGDLLRARAAQERER